MSVLFIDYFILNQALKKLLWSSYTVSEDSLSKRNSCPWFRQENKLADIGDLPRHRLLDYRLFFAQDVEQWSGHSPVDNMLANYTWGHGSDPGSDISNIIKYNENISSATYSQQISIKSSEKT